MRNIKKKWRNVGFRIGGMLGRRMSVPIEISVSQHNLVIEPMEEDGGIIPEIRTEVSEQTYQTVRRKNERSSSQGHSKRARGHH